MTKCLVFSRFLHFLVLWKQNTNFSHHFLILGLMKLESKSARIETFHETQTEGRIFENKTAKSN